MCSPIMTPACLGGGMCACMRVCGMHTRARACKNERCVCVGYQRANSNEEPVQPATAEETPMMESTWGRVGSGGGG